MPTQNQESSMVVTRKWNFPRMFITDSLDARIIGSFANAFHELIFQANMDDKSWERRMKTFSKHGLLDLAIPLTAKIGPFEFDVPDGDGGTTRIVKEFDEPISWGFEKHRIEINRGELEDPSYMEECASILAYMFVWRMLKEIAENPNQYQEPVVLFGVSNGKLPLLDKLCSSALGEFLDKFHRGQSNPKVLAEFLIRRSIEASVDDLPAFEIFDRLGERLSAMVEEANAEHGPKMMARVSAQVRLAKRELNLDTDDSDECCQPGDCRNESCDVVSIMTSKSAVPCGRTNLVDRNIGRYQFQHRNDD